MTGSNGDNQLGPGDSSSSNYVIGSPFTAKEAAGNLLWRYAKDIPSELWNLVKAPGQVYSGELQPSMTPGPNQLSIPEYALGLAGTGLGIGGGAALAGAELAPEGAITHFPAFHGTGVGTPFQQFENKFIDTGEGAQIYGWGHYVAQMPETAMEYRKSVGGTNQVPVNEQGFPMNQDEMTKKYFTPGEIIPGDPTNPTDFYKVHNYTDQNDWGTWEANLQRVRLDMGKAADKGYTGFSQMLSDPSVWNEEGEVFPTSMGPSNQQAQAMGKMKNWNMSDPGALLKVNVVPEEHEMLPWDVHYSEMHPDLQNNLKQIGLDPKGTQDPTGQQIYQKLSNMFEDDPRTSGINPDMLASQHLDASGIPGIRYYDAGSRHMGASIDHMNGFMGAPDYNLASTLAGSRPFHTTQLDTAMNDLYGDIRNHIKYTQDDLNMPGASKSEMTKAQNNINTLQSTMDWFQKEHEAGNFKLNDPRTSNYVVFDPRNIQIKTWNDQPLEPVNHDPFPQGFPQEVQQGPGLGWGY